MAILKDWFVLGVIALGLYVYVTGLHSDIASLTESNESLVQVNEAQAHYIAEYTRDVFLQTNITEKWHATGREVTAQAIEPVTIIERVMYEKAFNLDDPMPDELFLPLCRRVYETAHAYATFTEGQTASGVDAGLRHTLLAGCQGENRPTWRDSLQWILGMIERITQDRLDKAAIRQYVREEDHAN